MNESSPVGKPESGDETPWHPVARPGAEALKTLVVASLSAIPFAGPFVSGALFAAMEKSTAERLNCAFADLEARVTASEFTPEALMASETFRKSVAQLYESVVRQEAESKLQRIRNFIGHQLAGHRGDGDLIAEAVLKSLGTLPAAYIEALLARISATDIGLLEFAGAFGTATIQPHQIVAEEIPDHAEHDYCNSPASLRGEGLTLMCRELEREGILARVSDATELTYETTDFARRFVAYMVPPETRLGPEQPTQTSNGT